MDALDAIYGRRSIRRFQDRPVPRELIEQVLAATVQAPSGKNRQPWRFVVVQGAERRAEMVRIMREGIEAARAEGAPLGSSEHTAATMEQAPVTVFVFNGECVNYDEMDWSGADVQSIGGAVQTMCLASTALGLGSLWICDVFYAVEALTAWLGRQDCMICAVSLGYADETPEPRPRRPWQEVTTWLGQ